MRKVWSILGVLVLVGACQCAVGYHRPTSRNIDGIGAPAPSVGTQGLRRAGSQGATPSNQPTILSQSAQKFTEIGRIAGTDVRTITLQRPAGDQISLEVKPLSSIIMDGKPVSVQVLPEGADARASYLVQGDDRIIERIDVRSSSKAKQSHQTSSGRPGPQM